MTQIDGELRKSREVFPTPQVPLGISIGSPRTMPLLSEQLDVLKHELDTLSHPTRSQVAVLRFLNRVLGAEIAAAKLTDTSGHILTSIRVSTRPGPVKIDAPHSGRGTRATRGPLYELLTRKGARSGAFAIPSSWKTGTKAGAPAAHTLGLDFSAWYLFPPTSDSRHVVVGVGSSAAPFGAEKTRILKTVSERFSGHFVEVTPSGVRFPLVSIADDHRVLVSPAFRCEKISAHLNALISAFFGPLRREEGGWRLPAGLEMDLKRFEESPEAQTGRSYLGGEFCFSKRTQGRQLCLVVRQQPGRGFWLTCHEDLAQLDLRRRVRIACNRLSRDRASVCAVCLALLDGIHAEKELLRSSGLGALKPSSGRRLTNRAHAVLSSVLGSRECSGVEQTHAPRG